MATAFFSYQGRLNRRPYFFMSLALFVFFVLLAIPGLLFSLAAISSSGSSHFLDSLPVLGILAQLFALFLASFIVVRRFHDMDKDWYFVFLLLVPVLNMIIAAILLFKKGTDGPNRFGPDPLSKDAEIPVPVPSLPQQ